MLSRGGACPVARQLALALNSAAKRRDPEAAVAIFESHAASAGGALPLQSYNTVLALLTDHPSERARVRQHMREHKVRADETTVRGPSLRGRIAQAVAEPARGSAVALAAQVAPVVQPPRPRDRRVAAAGHARRALARRSRRRGRSASSTERGGGERRLAEATDLLGGPDGPVRQWGRARLWPPAWPPRPRRFSGELEAGPPVPSCTCLVMPTGGAIRGAGGSDAPCRRRARRG